MDKKIKIKKNGPYEVSGAVPLAEELIVCDPDGKPLKWEPGKSFPDRETYSLCRCGKSGNMPYCDGTHTGAGFKDDEDTKPPARKPFFEEADMIEGEAIDLYDVAPLCVNAGFCHRGGNIWRLASISDDEQSIQTVIDDANDCPSGRLVAAEKEGKIIEPDLEPAISVIEMPAVKQSGPLWVKGGITIESSGGQQYETRNRVTLCRCGNSKNMPFCDGSHQKVGFNDGSGAVQ